MAEEVDTHGTNTTYLDNLSTMVNILSYCVVDVRGKCVMKSILILLKHFVGTGKG